MSEPTKEEIVKQVDARIERLKGNIEYLEKWREYPIQDKKELAFFEAIRRLIEKGKPRVSREFVRGWVECLKQRGTDISWPDVCALLREAGVEVEK